MTDFEVERCTRHCAASGRPLVEGEDFFSVLLPDGTQLKRLDYAVEAWPGPPAEAIGWWKSKMPTSDHKQPKLAPSEILLKLFTELENVPDQRDLRYVLSLLMIRRRILRLEDTIPDEHGGELMMLYCARDESTHHVPIVLPDAARAEQIQDQLAKLLFVGGSDAK
ncbi:MAG: hypothetical protein JNM18_08745 [Planctomycetaceae bacterium]|nr:hypothetical protein [Planctomycetaceae bacterium]